KRKGVPATFFYIGKNDAVRGGSKSLPRRAIAEGHSIAVHSYTHNYSYLYPGGRADAERVASDYDKTVRAVRKAVGSTFSTNSFRYPGGHMSWRGMRPADQALEKKGVSWIDWNAMNGDGEANAPATSTAAAEYVNATLDSRENPNVAVILLHDYKNNQLTIGALPMIIDNLQEKGYEFGVID
ncbi:MAG: polysaccharide deacetylase family protein, partial [Propionibacteriales bacterium]|nr:polysaccharide deacetylase family protein [Propionibacteriales bacterium]